ncbi:MAG: DUF4476 domain-containing protein [Ginsengibacter sp.]
MKYIIFCFLIFTFSYTTISAQQSHFLYFQTEAKQPFYIKLDNKVFGSASSGYLVLPNLKEGNYKLVFGFPKNEWPEQTIEYTLAKDAGYLLKNFSDKGWGLFDLQSLSVVMANNELAGNNSIKTEIKKDNFSEMLATVVNDSTIMQKEVVEKKEIKEPSKVKIVDNITPETPATAVNDSAIRQTDVVVKSEVKQPSEEKIAVSVASVPVNKEIVQLPGTNVKFLYSVITKNLQLKSKGGLEMIYMDEYNNNKDTIRIFMPVQDAKQKKEPKRLDVSNTEKADPASNISQPAKAIDVESKADSVYNSQSSTETTKVESEIISTAQLQANAIKLANKIDNINRTTTQAVTINVEDKSDSNIPQQPIVNLPPGSATDENQKKDKMSTSTNDDTIEFLPAKTGMANSKCKQQANEDDFLKLRKKMAAEAEDDDMINAAKKVFKAKCFTTKDIKNLGALFLNDHGRYNFFDAAYSYVSDSNMFPSLQNQLTDDYYIKRFKAMIEK